MRPWPFLSALVTGITSARIQVEGSDDSPNGSTGNWGILSSHPNGSPALIVPGAVPVIISLVERPNWVRTNVVSVNGGPCAVVLYGAGQL